MPQYNPRKAEMTWNNCWEDQTQKRGKKQDGSSAFMTTEKLENIDDNSEEIKIKIFYT